MRHLKTLAAVILFAAAPALAATPSITKTEARYATPEMVKRKVLGQLGDILHTWPGKAPAKAPVNILRYMDYWTTTHATSVEGLCTYDDVQFRFEPPSQSGLGANTPVRVKSISATPRYRFLTAPSAPTPDDIEAPEQRRLEQACAALGDNHDGFFLAVDDQTATQAAWLVGQIAKAAAQPQPPFKLDCSEAAPLTAANCHKALSAVTLESLGDAEDCPREQVDGKGLDCWVLDAGGHIFTVRALDTDGTLQIASVSVADEIVLWHTVPD